MTTSAPRLARRLRDDHGWTTMYVAVAMTALLAFVGLLSDGASKMRAGRDATVAAREAGRAASQEMRGDIVLGQDPTIDTAAAATAARRYLRETGTDGTVTVSGSTVTVTTHIPWSSTFRIVPSTTLTGTAVAGPHQVAP